MKKLESKTALITGGGTGIGRAIAHEFACEGARIVLCARRLDPLASTVAELKSQGTEAIVMDSSDEETLELGRRHTSGRECYPCLLTTGDFIRQINRPDFDRKKSAFFMASADGPCRFGQYNHLHRNVLDKLGYEDVPILALDQDNEYRNCLDNLGPDLERNAFQGVAAVDARR